MLVAVAVVLAAAALTGVVVLHAYLPLMVFVAVLGAILLDGVSTPLCTHLHLPRWVAVCAVALLALGLLVAAGWLFGPAVSDEVSALLERLPEALNRLERAVARTGWGRSLVSTEAWDVERLTRVLSGMWGPVAGAFATAFAVATGALVVVVVAFFLALDPRPYVSAVVHLARPERREHVRDVLRSLGRALRWWLVGRFSSMAAVGVLTVVGLKLLGVPLATLLGLLAGLFSFIPFFGPVLSAAPAILVALGESPKLALWVVALYCAVQFLEGHFITPLIQERTVSLPPAAVILSQVLMGGLFGLLGVLVATPLTLTGIVLVQILYLRDVLDEPVVPMGDHGHAEARAEGQRS